MPAQRGCRNVVIIALILGSAVLVAVVLGAAIYYAGQGGRPGGEVVALIEIKGGIFEVDDLLEEIRDRRRDERVKAVVVRIDSPGGAVGPSQELFAELQKTSEEGKLVVASMGSVAASGGLYVACAADYIMANPGTITGSIGVVANFPNVDGLMEKVGISFNTLKTGPYKDSGSSFRPMTDDERRVLEATLYDVLDQFTAHVAEGRGMEQDAVTALADGRIYTGRQAIAHGLVDAEGTLYDAIAYAAEQVGIEGEPRLLRRQVRRWGPFEFSETLDRFLPQTQRSLRPGIYYLWP